MKWCGAGSTVATKGHGRSPDRPRAASCAGNRPKLVARSLQFLHEVGPDPAPAKGFGHVHVYVGIRFIVVKQHASARDHGPVDLHDPLAAALALPHGVLNLVSGGHAPHGGAIRTMRGRRVITEHDLLGSDVASIRQDHHGR